MAKCGPGLVPGDPGGIILAGLDVGWEWLKPAIALGLEHIPRAGQEAQNL